jgi:hypothetical protein
MVAALPSLWWLAGCSSADSSPPAAGTLGAAPATDAALGASPVEISIEGAFRVVRSNGIPNHATGTFPNRHDPEPISEQRYVFRMPASPEKATTTTDLCPLGKRTYRFGIALNGVTFDPSGPWYHGGNEYDWHFEATADVPRAALGLDSNNAHTQAGGQYHYHGVPTGLVEVLRATQPTGMLLLGYAADGFPVYASSVPSDPWDPTSSTIDARASYRLRAGTRPTAPGGTFDGTFEQDYEYVAGLGDLDECNGRDGVTPEYPDGTYYYVVTENYPYIPRQLRGSPDDSFLYGPAGRPSEPGGAGAPVPPELRNYKPSSTPVFDAKKEIER